MSKFKVGDKARVKRVRTNAGGCWYIGSVVTISSLGAGLRVYGYHECTVLCSDGTTAYPMFDQLEPIIKKQETSTWEAIEAEFNWNPSKAPIKAIAVIKRD